MLSVDLTSTIGSVTVKTTQNQGLSPEYWTERIVEKLVSVSDQADPMVKAQAMAFKDKIYYIVLTYMKQAVASDRSTIAGLLDKQGHRDMADIIRRL